jgi:NADPH:quinone reductase-like Zn-dependent oxidoreductase
VALTIGICNEERQCGDRVTAPTTPGFPQPACQWPHGSWPGGGALWARRRESVAFIDEIEHAITERHFDRHRRVLLREPLHDGHEGRAMPGKSVLLLGTGGVSIWALQLAKAAGLRAFITSSSDEKLDKARSLGADGTVNYRATPNWHDEVKLKFTEGRGVDLVLEVGGKDTMSGSLAAAAMGATVAVIGGVSGFGGAFEPLQLIGGAKRLAGIYVGNRRMMEDLGRFVQTSRIAPVVDRVFGFGQAREAYEHLAAANHFGKVVVEIDGAS